MWNGLVSNYTLCKYIRIGVGYTIDCGKIPPTTGIILGYITERMGMGACTSSDARFLIDQDGHTVHPSHADERPCTLCAYHRYVSEDT